MDSHPTFSERIAASEWFEEPRTSPDLRLATDLLAEVEKLEEQLTRLLSEDASAARTRESTAFDAAAGKYCNRIVIFGAGGLGRKTAAGLRRVQVIEQVMHMTFFRQQASMEQAVVGWERGARRADLFERVVSPDFRARTKTVSWRWCLAAGKPLWR